MECADNLRRDMPCTTNPVSQAADFEAQSRSIEAEEQRLRAHLEAVLKRKEDIRFAMEESRRQAEFESEKVAKRIERLKDFRELFENEIICGLQDLASTDPAVKQKLRSIVQPSAGDQDRQVVRLLTTKVLFGNDQSFLEFLATRVLESDRDAIAPDSTSNIDQPTDVIRDSIDKSTIPLPVPKHGQPNPLMPDGSERQCEEPIFLTNQDSSESIIPHVGINSDQYGRTGVITHVEEECRASASLPSAKRRRITDIEDAKDTIQVAVSSEDINKHDTITPMVEDGTRYFRPGNGVADDSMMSSTIEPNDDTMVISETRSIHSLDGVSVDSRSSSAAHLNPRAQPQKAVADKAPCGSIARFVKRLEEHVEGGIDVASQLMCQKCTRFPTNARMSACGHLYCSKCVSSLRKECAGDKARCTACSNDVGKKCTGVGVQHILQWRKTFVEDQRMDTIQTEDED